MGSYCTKSSIMPLGHEVQLESESKPSLTITPPPEFNGPVGFWTPEDLFSASISSCFVLTFKALARVKKMEWNSLEAKVDACLEKTKNGLWFTKVDIYPKLVISNEDIEPYRQLLLKAKEACLVTKSMKCEFNVFPEVFVET